jgi:hypothetical protein
MFYFFKCKSQQTLKKTQEAQGIKDRKQASSGQIQSIRRNRQECNYTKKLK